MKLKPFLAVATAAAMVMGAAGADAATAASVNRGKQLVTRNCAMCHAVGATGKSHNSEAPLFRELHQRYPVEMLAEALAEGILTGHPAMPEFRFTPSETDDIIDYLESIQTRGSAQRDRLPPATIPRQRPA